METAAFDAVAEAYDGQFTDTAVGRLQRDLVRDFLKVELGKRDKAKVLELNCGTGADALWIAENGASVLATDLSGGMVEVARRAARGKDVDLQFEVGDLREVVRKQEARYDLVFSNFGGLNCIGPEDLETFSKQLRSILSPGGIFVAVVMPRVCLWESLYFLAKGRPKAAVRRWRGGPVPAPLGEGVFQDTWYYSPSDFSTLFGSSWSLTKLQAIGFFLPPSYLDPFFHSRPRFLSTLGQLDRSALDLSARAAWADHFLIALSPNS